MIDKTDPERRNRDGKVWYHYTHRSDEFGRNVPTELKKNKTMVLLFGYRT